MNQFSNFYTLCISLSMSFSLCTTTGKIVPKPSLAYLLYTAAKTHRYLQFL